MTDKTRITYLFDPLCGWCYGASLTLEILLARPDLEVELAPTGLFAGVGARPMDAAFADYAWSNDQRISRLTGLPFSDAYRHNVLGDRTRLFDSGPATLAVIAVSLTAPGRDFEALRAIQRARYVDGQDITDRTVLAQVLRGLNLEAAADRLATPDDALTEAYRTRTERARLEMRRLGADGVPALVAGSGGQRQLLRSSALFGSLNLLLAGLKAA